jgi:GAF domain-containing protein
MYDQAELKPIDEGVLADELFSNTPMRVLGGEVVGTLSIANDPLHPTSPEDQAFFEQVSDQIALALEGARLTAQTQSALAQSESLYQLSSTLNTAATYDDILRVLRENTILGKNQLHIGISVFDRTWTPEEEPLWIDTLAHWSRFPTESGIENDHFTIASFPAARTILHPDTPTLIEDFETDERIDENTRLLYTKRFGAKSAIFFPLVVTGQWIGYINALYQQQVAFPENEIRQLGALIAQASTMVNNLRQVGRIQQQAERETTLNIISQKIQNATTVEAVLQIAARELGHALGAPMTIAQLSMKDKN